MSVVLRPVVEGDLGLILAWRNLPAVREGMFTNHRITTEEHREWWMRVQRNPSIAIFVAEHDLKPCGVVTFRMLDEMRYAATWGFYLGVEGHRGLGREMCRAAVGLAFDSLKLSRLSSEVLSFNRRSIDLHLALGFAVEGIAREGFLRDGVKHDVISFGLLALQWAVREAPRLARPQSAARLGLGATFESICELPSEGSLVELFGSLGRDSSRQPRHLPLLVVESIVGKHLADAFAPFGGIVAWQQIIRVESLDVRDSIRTRVRVVTDLERELVVETLAYAGTRLVLTGFAGIRMVDSHTEPASDASD